MKELTLYRVREPRGEAGGWAVELMKAQQGAHGSRNEQTKCLFFLEDAQMVKSASGQASVGVTDGLRVHN